MFSFAAPFALALAVIALPIIGFYILKVRLRRVSVSTNLFWKQVYEEKPPRSLWQQFRHWISLAVQLTILAFLILALADPYFPWQKQQAKRICLVIDNSASMSVKHDGKSRLEEAKLKALAILGGVRELDEVAVVVANDTPQVLVGMTNHIPTLQDGVRNIAESSRTTSFSPAIALGKRLVSSHPHGEIIVFSDGMGDALQQEPDLSADTTTSSLNETNATSLSIPHPDTQVHWEIVGMPQNNVAITQFQVRRSLVDAIGYEILLEVLNASKESVEGKIELYLNDSIMDVLPLRLDPGESWARSIEKTSLAGGKVLAELTDIKSASGNKIELNAIAIDDQAYAVLAPRKTQDILVVSPGNLFLRRAFEANPLVNVTVTNELPENWPQDHLIVLHNVVPSVLPQGNVLVIDPTMDSEFWKLDGEIADPIVTEQLNASPLMRHIRLDNVIVPKAKKLRFEIEPKLLAGTVLQEVIYAEIAKPQGRCLLLNVPLEESDLTFRTAFPILVTNSLHWFSKQNDKFAPSMATGSTEVLKLSRNDVTPDHSLFLRSPTGNEQSISFDRNQEQDDELRCTLGPFTTSGVWEVVSKPLNDSGSKNREQLSEDIIIKQIAVNLASDEESNVLDRRMDIENSELNRNASMAGFGQFNRPLWFYLALLGCIVCILEWGLHQRRILS